VARWLRVRKQVLLLIVSFLASSIYRTVMGVWPFSGAAGEAHASMHRTSHGLLFSVDRGPNGGSGTAPGRTVSLEVNGSFPFFHMYSVAPGLVAVAALHTPCLSERARDPEVNAMQFGFGVANTNSGVCATNPGNGLQFSSNPGPASTYVGNPPAIDIGEAAPNEGCGGCGCVTGYCGGPPSPYCFDCCYCYCDCPSCDGL
jgi:hypothetical protein